MTLKSGRQALLIGTNAYEGYPDLKAPLHDVELLAEVLGDPEIGGYEVEKLGDADLRTVKGRLETWVKQARPSDHVLLYISGHGIRDDDGRLHFPLTDSEPDRVQATCVSASWLSALMHSCRSRKIVVIVDTCFSGAIQKEFGQPWMSAFDHFSGGAGFVAITSSNNRQESFQATSEDGRLYLSTFTRALIEGLRTGEADKNSDGFVSIDELFQYLVDSISNLDNRQIPTRAGYQEGDLIVACAPATASATGREYDSQIVEARATYLRWVIAEVGKLDLSAVIPNAAKRRISVADVYTELNTRTSLTLEIRGGELESWRLNALEQPSISRALSPPRQQYEPLLARLREWIKRSSRAGRGFADRSYSYPLSAADAISLYHHTVLTGDPGGGKTTFARHLAHRLALRCQEPEEGLEETDEFWSMGQLTPVFIRLRDLVRTRFPDVESEVSVTVLVDYVSQQVVSAGIPSQIARQILLDDLNHGTLFLILDGLDEVPEAQSEQRRAQIVSLVELVSIAFPKTRILVTGRPHAYAGDWVLPGFAHAQLSSLSLEQAEQLAVRFFRLVGSNSHIESEREASSFLHALTQVQAELRNGQSLWATPLLLTLMCALWLREDGAGGSRQFPASRGEVYRAAVDLLLERWTVKYRDSDQSLAELLSIDAERLRNALERLAYVTHSRWMESRQLPTFTYGDLLDSVLSADPRARVNSLELGEYLSRQSGLVIELAPNELTFSHLTFQEHLAAVWLSGRREFPDSVVGIMQKDATRWRDVVDLVGAELEYSGRMADVVSLCKMLLVEPAVNFSLHESWVIIEAACLIAIRSGLMLRMDDELSQLVRSAIGKVVTQPDCPSVSRALLGRVLSVIGDYREGVGVGSDGTPELAFGEEFTVRADEGSYQCRLGKFTVTNAQFKAFMEAEDGYATPDWWVDAPEDEWSNKGRSRFEGEEFSAVRNYPLTNVSWWEGVAFSRWLSNRCGVTCGVQTLEEWSVVSGAMRREADGGVAILGNGRRSGIGGPCAVGLFPIIGAAHGCADIGSNVAEWTSTHSRSRLSSGELGRSPSVLVVGSSYEDELDWVDVGRPLARRPGSSAPQRGLRIALRSHRGS